MHVREAIQAPGEQPPPDRTRAPKELRTGSVVRPSGTSFLVPFLLVVFLLVQFVVMMALLHLSRSEQVEGRSAEAPFPADQPE